MIGFVLVYLIVLSSQAFAFKKNLNSTLDCSTFKTEVEIFDSFPFLVSIQPVNVSNDTTYARFGSGPVITQLYLFHETSIPLTTFCLKNLQKLVIISDNITIPPEIALLNASLQHLIISSKNDNLFSTKNKTTTSTTDLNLPSELFSLTGLKTFIVSGYNLEALSPAIDQLYNLETLEISYCGLETLPETIGRLSYLATLKLMGNRLKSLPMIMKQMRTLSTVDVSNNPLLDSLDALGGPRIISYLNATNCAINHLPFNITGLEILDLSYNKLVSLDGVETFEAASHYATVGRFFFSNNQIQFIPIPLNQTKIFQLALDSNNLTTVPPEIFNINELRSLYVQNNQLNDQRREWVAGLGRYAGIYVQV